MNPIPFKPVELTPMQQRAWEDTLAACTWIAPGFVHLIYTLLANTSNKNVALFTEDIPYVAATDGYQLIFKPSQFFKLPLLERVFAVLHEVCHEMWNHCRVAYAFRKAGKITVGSKSLPWIDEYANVIQDLIINDTLIQSKFGTFNKAWLHDTSVATFNDNWVTAYFRNWKEPLRQQCEGSGGKGNTGEGKPMPGRFDQHLDPHRSEGKRPEEAPVRQDAAWEVATKTAMEIQRAQGRLPAAMEMFFKELLQPKVKWEDHLKGEMTRMLGSGVYTWRRLDRRMLIRDIGAPGMTGKGARVVVVGGDTSGSVFADPKLVMRFLSEVGGILEEVNPEEVHVVWCDAAVKRVDICTDATDVQKMMYDGVPGGGGTDFTPVFKYIEDNLDDPPDALVYLTDGYGRFPAHAPDYPVVWGNITPGQKYPFGAVINVETD